MINNVGQGYYIIDLEGVSISSEVRETVKEAFRVAAENRLKDVPATYVYSTDSEKAAS